MCCEGHWRDTGSGKVLDVLVGLQGWHSALGVATGPGDVGQRGWSTWLRGCEGKLAVVQTTDTDGKITFLMPVIVSCWISLVESEFSLLWLYIYKCTGG